jgi:hypothetical protein
MIRNHDLRASAAAIVCLVGVGLRASQPANATAIPRLEPLPVEAALSERSLGLYSAVRLSPDGGRVAHTVCDPRRVPFEPDPRYQGHSRTGVLRFGLGCDVWVTDTSSAESRNLTDGTGSNWAPSWSPDGSLLAFYSDRSGLAALWVWSPASGSKRRLSDVIVRPWGASSNISSQPIYPPIRVEILGYGFPEYESEDDKKRNAENAPPALNSANGKPKEGAVFEFGGAIAGSEALEPGAQTNPVLMRFQMVDPEKTPSLQLKAIGMLPSAP